MREVERVATFVHGALSALHGLSLFYHLSHGKRGRKHALIHAAALAYDLYSVGVHKGRLDLDKIREAGL